MSSGTTGFSRRYVTGIHDALDNAIQCFAPSGGRFMVKLDAFTAATRRAARPWASGPIAGAARYDRRRDRIVVSLDTGLELPFPPRVAQGLESAAPSDLNDIEISASGLGIHFPRLAAQLYLPALLLGVFGSKSWMAAQLGAAGGRTRSTAKTTAARRNRRRGGRPRKAATG